MKTETPTPTPSQRVDQVCWGINRDSGVAKLAYQLATELEQAQADLKNYMRWHDQKDTIIESIKELVNDE